MAPLGLVVALLGCGDDTIIIVTDRPDAGSEEGGGGAAGREQAPADSAVSTMQSDAAVVSIDRDAGLDATARDAGGAGDAQVDSGVDAALADDAGLDASSGDAGVDAAALDAAVDAAADASVDSGMDAGLDAGADADAGDPVPAEWTCADVLWSDGLCDCGCGSLDSDCGGLGCSDPGCRSDSCDACFDVSGGYMECAAPGVWSCSDAQLSDLLCDCGCDLPDPACDGSGCVSPGCRKAACQRRHGCTAAQIRAGDDCSSVDSVPPAWSCPLDLYAAGNGCDCGCGAPDPDCTAGCSAGRCYDADCAFCHDGEGRPYSCAAAQAGWDEDIDILDVPPRSKCNDLRFEAGDGCDCGCGGPDPDCGTQGCAAAGCADAACDRCTDAFTGAVRGCGVPAAWVTAGCAPESYGTGDGCDCGCGSTDPDCGGEGCTTDGCTDSGCDVCHDSVSGLGYVLCDDWTCTDPDAFSNLECDCGCGAIDPYCRDLAVGAPLYSCLDADCESELCDFCNDASGTRSACGGNWNVAGCGARAYGMDGRCDCGCGAVDPDCAAGTGCTDPGCEAPGCEVCHGFGTELRACYEWSCDLAAFGDGSTCDCGCASRDPDCGTGGCREPGCSDAACMVCHDAFGRAVPCP